jgi:dihydroflavonol-4-reductase
MTRILVTGGSGFIGKHLVSALIAQGRQVRVLDLQPPPRALPQVQHVRGSVLDRDLVDRAMDGVDEVYHLAGLPGMWLPRKADFHTVNFGGTEIVIETARKRGIKRFLHCSTESILFRVSPSMVPVADDALLPDDMPGPIYALENACRPVRHAGGRIRISGDYRLSHHARRPLRPQRDPADRDAPVFSRPTPSTAS